MKRLLDWIRGRKSEAPPVLRNRVGGMAWVRSEGLRAGAEQLAGSAVKTVSVSAGGMWRIEPLLGYIATDLQRFPDGTLYHPGEVVVVVGLHDSALEPWKDTGLTDAEVGDLYAPQLTTREAA